MPRSKQTAMIMAVKKAFKTWTAKRVTEKTERQKLEAVKATWKQSRRNMLEAAADVMTKKQDLLNKYPAVQEAGCLDFLEEDDHESAFSSSSSS